MENIGEPPLLLCAGNAGTSERRLLALIGLSRKADAETHVGW